jgi:hypothetical protein
LRHGDATLWGGKDLGNEGVTAEKANSMVKEKQSVVRSEEPFFSFVS